MDSKEKFRLIKTVQENNILPITSACGMECRFCSHYQNPPEIDVCRFGHLNLDLVKELTEYISPQGPIILGESATRIIEGEPFIHPNFKKIINILRNKWSKKEIRITTHGGLLDQESVNFLEKNKPVVLNISLNCPTLADRAFLMSDSHPNKVFEGLKLLRNSDITFHGSLVALPQIMGWDNVERTINLLGEEGSQTVRVFLPGYTDYSKSELSFSTKMEAKLRELVEMKNKQLATPVIMEPPYITDLQPIIKGIIKNSPADRAGLRIDDILISINNKKPFSRVEAFNQLYNQVNPVVKIKRDDKVFDINIEKEAKERSGVVMNYDLSKKKFNELQQTIKNEAKSGDHIGLLTSGFAFAMIQSIAEILENKYSEYKISVINVENKTFGGSIKAVGLLTVNDILNTNKEKMVKNLDLFIIPGIIFDDFGKDLIGKDFKSLEERLGIRCYKI